MIKTNKNRKISKTRKYRNSIKSKTLKQKGGAKLPTSTFDQVMASMRAQPRSPNTASSGSRLTANRRQHNNYLGSRFMQSVLQNGKIISAPTVKNFLKGLQKNPQHLTGLSKATGKVAAGKVAAGKVAGKITKIRPSF
jgi:hypothetical protein